MQCKEDNCIRILQWWCNGIVVGYLLPRVIMQCEESDWIGILSTVIFTGVMTVLPLPEKRYVRVPIAFVEMFALMLLVANFYFILYVSAWFSASTNDTLGSMVPVIVLVVAVILTWFKKVALGVIAFFVSNAATASLGSYPTVFISLAVSIIAGVVIRKSLDSEAVTKLFMYLNNAVLFVFSVMASTTGAPGTPRNKEPPNFYILCARENGSVTILDNIVHQTLLLFYIGGAVLLRICVVNCYEICSRCNNNSKDKRKQQEMKKESSSPIVNNSTTITINKKSSKGYGPLVTDGSSGDDGDIDMELPDDECEGGVELGSGLTSSADGDVSTRRGGRRRSGDDGEQT
jgi:hypothetical protein